MPRVQSNAQLTSLKAVDVSCDCRGFKPSKNNIHSSQSVSLKASYTVVTTVQVDAAGLWLISTSTTKAHNRHKS